MPMGQRLQGKVALVTGAAGGLGRATALAMADEGAQLALTDIEEAGLLETTDLLRSQGHSPIAHAGDVAEAHTHATLVAAALQRFGQLDVLCNVAGVLGAGALADVDAKRFWDVMRVNCFAQLVAAQQAADALRRSGRGSIVNVASVGALVALPLMTAYCASKSAVAGLTRALALELAPHVRCNAVCPGGIDTPMARGLLDSVPPDEREGLLANLTGRQLFKRFAQPREIAATLVFLASDESAFLTGSVIAADAGHSAS
jgi:NAD(P)-dependent dehydrogenase (short-subunit alcohol dehydrogenase family)